MSAQTAPNLAPSDWEFKNEPPGAGWYAISYSWDAAEGIFNDADFWDGARWADCLPIFAIAGPFDDQEQARQWAAAHDMEG